MSRYVPWEYHVEGGVEQPRLDELGAAGWELVGVVSEPETGAPVAYFKREAADLRERVTLDHRARFERARGDQEQA